MSNSSSNKSQSQTKNNPDSTGHSDQTFDAIIVGAGSAGLAALREVAKRTKRFLIINDGAYGTTCARVGCMPSKLLIEAANAYHRRHTFETFGITGSNALAVDIPAVLRRVRRLRDDFVAGTVSITDELGARSVSGRAQLLSSTQVQVNGQTYSAKGIILAPGSSPILPPAMQALGARVLTTDTLFEQTTLGPRMAVIGMGPLGIEMAQALARLGVAVHGYATKEMLGGMSDPDVNAELRQALERDITLNIGAEASLHAVEGGIEVRSGAHRTVVDQVLVAIGRSPNLQGLGLATLGVPLDKHGMPPVNPKSMQVGDSPVYLAGDAHNDRPLLHEAADEGHIAGLNAMAPTPQCFERRIPLAIVFCDPNAAVVGQGFSALQRQDGLQFVTGSVNFVGQGRARAGQRNQGRLSVYADAASGCLLGAELCAPAGEHLAHLLALAVSQKLSVAQVLGMPFYHPVLEEGLRSALRDAARQLPDAVSSDLAHCGPIGALALD